MPVAARLLPTLVAAVALIPAPGAGAATWTPAQNISESANDLGGAGIAVDQRGRALATWNALRWEPGTSHGHYVDDGWRAATRAPGAAAFDAPRTVPTFTAPPVLYGVSRAVGLDQRSLGWQRCGQRTTLRARFGSSAGDFGAPRTITTSLGPGGNGSPVVAADDAGVVLVAWAQATRSDCSRSAIEVALRRPGASTFSAPVTLRGSGRSEAPSVAVGAGGDLLVAWHRRVGEGRTVVEARVRRAGRSWDGVARLGTSTVAAPLRTAVAPNGRAYVAWGAQSISESTGLTASFHVAVRPAGASGFRAAQTLESVRTATAYLPRLGPELALAGNGAVVAWTGHDSAWRVRAADTDSHARFGAAQTVSPATAGAVLGGIAALADGTTAIAWSQLDDEHLVRDVQATVRPAGGSFGAPELVNDGTLRAPSVALDRTTGRPTVVWAQRLGPVTSVSTITAFVRASTRTGG